MEFPRDKSGRLVCIVAGLFFGIGASWLFVSLFMHVGFRLDRLWVLEFLAMFAVFGWGLLVWGIAMPSWITRVVSHATAYIMVAIFVLFFPIGFEFILLAMRGQLP